VVLELFLFSKPVVAAVSGHALGAGAIFGLACDVRLFAEGAFKYGLNEVPGGLFVPTFGIVTARASAPAEHLTAMIMHGRVFAPAEALAMRIAQSVHAPEALLPAALAQATLLAELSGGGYAYTKRLLRGPMEEEARRGLPKEVAHLATALGTRK
jgi:enoyl-CoA hydratase/carnithine racemase